MNLRRPHADTTRTQVIEALGMCRTWKAAATALGYYGPHGLRQRARGLGVMRYRYGDVVVIEVIA